MTQPRAFITGLSGTVLTPGERAFLRDARPWGVILFKRNIDSPAQVISLIDDIHEIVGAQAPVLIDQEGGRVQRMGPPHWPAYPPGAVYAALHESDPDLGLAAARLGARLIAHDLAAVGITVDCLPLADVPQPGADAIIGDRAYGTTPDRVAQLAQAVADGLADGGVLPVLKHIPGHGRALADSHLALPVVDATRVDLEKVDFEAFRRLSALPMAMTAHVVFSAIDPANPATTSATMVAQVIRGVIGFDGLLMSDDVSMGALSGSLAERTRAALGAGCDIALHCNGRMDEMLAVASEAPELTGRALQRADAALAARRPPTPLDIAAARREFAAMLATAGQGSAIA